jgi:hypothetical protein
MRILSNVVVVVTNAAVDGHQLETGGRTGAAVRAGIGLRKAAVVREGLKAIGAGLDVATVEGLLAIGLIVIAHGRSRCRCRKLSYRLCRKRKAWIHWHGRFAFPAGRIRCSASRK